MSYAIVDIGGFQEKVEKGMTLKVPRMAEKKEGDTITLSSVMLLSDGKDAKIGTPFVDGATVEAKVLGHGRHPKIRVFKMKHRKRYRVTQGHRQDYTEIEVTKV